MTDIKSATAKLLKDNFQIDPQTTDILFEEGILDFRQCRNKLIQIEYAQKAKPKCKNLLKNNLAGVYNVSVELVEKIVAKKK